ncbi:MAG: RHS repeat-associated core domain-containing protein, partial [Candidatus Sulfotelmatobacter sp.]
DANGNTLSDASGKSYTWDFENRLAQAIVPGTNGGTTTFRYDPFGRRIQKSGPLGTTNYLYDGKNLLEEADQSGNVVARYTDVHRDLDEPLAELRSGTASFYQGDALGTVTSLSNTVGALASTYAYDSFGKLTASTGTITNPLQYTAREFDSETDEYYYRARYYDPNSGRFLSEDPLRFRATIDFYAYAINDPVRWSDPDGKGISWGPIYDWYEKSRNYADLIVCGAKARWCLKGLANTVSSIRQDPTIGSPDNPNSSPSTGLDQIHAACHSDQNCKDLFCGCLATIYTSSIPLAPPSWIGDMFPEPCGK